MRGRPNLPLDGEVRRIGTEVAIAGRRLHEDLWSAAVALGDGTVVVVAHDTDEIDRAKATVIRALGLALVPTLAFSILGGVLLAGRAKRRLASTEAAVARVMRWGPAPAAAGRRGGGTSSTAWRGTSTGCSTRSNG